MDISYIKSTHINKDGTKSHDFELDIFSDLADKDVKSIEELFAFMFTSVSDVSLERNVYMCGVEYIYAKNISVDTYEELEDCFMEKCETIARNHCDSEVTYYLKTSSTTGETITRNYCKAEEEN